MIKVLQILAPGTNCDKETKHAFELCGAKVREILITELIKNKNLIKEHQIISFPGGFTYGDDIASGKILALLIEKYLKDEILDFVERGNLIIGICNGFQVLVKCGLLGDYRVSLVMNKSCHFEARWVHLKVSSKKCIFTEGIDFNDLPVAHAEGRFVGDNDYIEKLKREDEIVFQYIDEKGTPTMKYPLNPNGSSEAIAGICDKTGRILGMMPHPERFLTPYHHPDKRKIYNQTGLKIFQNAINYFKK